MLESLSTTKQSAAGRGDSIYRYYAGYPASFVTSLLEQLKVAEDATILDPWNGSGTTTEVCSLRGLRSIGIDVNPLMRVVAEVRSMQRSNIGERVAALEAALEASRAKHELASPHVAAARLFNRLEETRRIARDEPVALFVFAAATRAVFYSVRTRNPTWFSMRKAKAIISSEAEIKSACRLELDKLRRWIAQDVPNARSVAPILITGDARTTWVGSRVDHIISSPPYLTRIDYAQKTLPELLFLSEIYGLQYVSLRESMLGTVLTGRGAANDYRPPMPTAKAALDAIKVHESKASATYYLKFYSAYFEGLLGTLENLLPLLSVSGTVTLVTQGSYYKKIYVDLPQIIREAMAGLGFDEFDSHSFKSATHMALINTRTYASKQKAPEETVSSFRRKR